MQEELVKQKSPHTGAWLWIVMAVFYTISPLDFIPDVIPIYGWIDDGLIMFASILNLVQSYLKVNHEAVANVFRRIKLGVVQGGFFAIVGVAAIVLCTKLGA